MKLGDILKSTAIVRASVDMNMEISDISYDSRTTKPGNVFVAIRGNSTNGHLYISEALANGAVAVVCETVQSESSTPCVIVKNTRTAVAEMSSNFFGNPQNKLKIVGITGTNGKTTTAYLLREILLKKFGNVVGLIGTNQNIIAGKSTDAVRTTPHAYEVYKMLAQMCEAGVRYAVMEVSSHAIEQERVHGIHYEVAVFTNITQDHLDFHENMENYLEVKSRIFARCNTAVTNADDEHSQLVIEGKSCLKMSYAVQTDNADMVAKSINFKPGKVSFEAVLKNEIQRISVGIPGLFTVYNALAAACAAYAMGVGLSDIAFALQTAPGVLGRCENVPTDADYELMIDYAHTPDGMENVLRMARQMCTGRIVTVFGCGGDRDKTKRPIMGKVAARLSDILVISSDNPRSENPDIIIDDIMIGAKEEKCQIVRICDRKEAIQYALSVAKSGDQILLLGKGHEKYKEQNGEKSHFDEREIVKDFLSSKK